MNKTTDGCLVLAPGLLSASISAQDPHAADNLCRLLGFAEQIECPNDELLSLESLVSKYLLPTVESSCAAVFTYGKDFKPGAEDQSLAVLRTDPAYQQIDMNNATLGNPLELDISAAECKQLQQTLNNHFAEDGIRFESNDPHRWYCHFKALPQLTTTPVSAAIGRDVTESRPVGTDARWWRSRLAEIEMLLFEHPVNIARQQNNKLPVNTLWLWGEGDPVNSTVNEGVTVYSDNFYTSSIAGRFDLSLHELTTHGQSTKSFAFESANDQALLVTEKFSDPTLTVEKVSGALEWFDQSVSLQLWRGLGSNGWPQVTLWFGDNRLYRVSASVKKQLWRRLFSKAKPLSAFLPADQIAGNSHPE